MSFPGDGDPEGFDFSKIPIMPAIPMEIHRLCPGYCGWQITAGDADQDYELLLDHLYNCARGWAAWSQLRQFAHWVVRRAVTDKARESGQETVVDHDDVVRRGDQLLMEFAKQPIGVRFT